MNAHALTEQQKDYHIKWMTIPMMCSTVAQFAGHIEISDSIAEQVIKGIRTYPEFKQDFETGLFVGYVRGMVEAQISMEVQSINDEQRHLLYVTMFNDECSTIPPYNTGKGVMIK